MSDDEQEELTPIERDIVEIVAEAKKLNALSTVQELVTFLKSNLVPFMETHVAETVQQADALDDLIGQADDILQPETAQIFAGVIMGGVAMAAKVRELAPKAPTGKLADAVLEQQVAAYEALCKQAGDLLPEITLDRSDEYEDADEDDEDDEDEYDDEDDDQEDE